jgi:hypothetical protein
MIGERDVFFPFSCKQSGALRLWAVLDPTRTVFPMIVKKNLVLGQYVSNVLPVRNDNFELRYSQGTLALPICNSIENSMQALPSQYNSGYVGLRTTKQLPP